jgi:hypothetical protein
VDVVNPILPPFSQLFPVLGLLVCLGLIALGFLALYGVVRVAVRRALRDHQLWLESRGNGSVS